MFLQRYAEKKKKNNENINTMLSKKQESENTNFKDTKLRKSDYYHTKLLKILAKTDRNWSDADCLFHNHL